MSSTHFEVGPELRQLAQALLDRLDPLVRVAVAATTGRGAGEGKCQQVWCPVCALAAVVQGEQHPMLDVIAEHSGALLDAVRSVVDGTQEPETEGDGPVDETDTEPKSPGRYQHIPILVDD